MRVVIRLFRKGVENENACYPHMSTHFLRYVIHIVEMLLPLTDSVITRPTFAHGENASPGKVSLLETFLTFITSAEICQVIR